MATVNTGQMARVYQGNPEAMALPLKTVLKYQARHKDFLCKNFPLWQANEPGKNKQTGSGSASDLIAVLGKMKIKIQINT